jgi:hypothetical protein
MTKSRFGFRANFGGGGLKVTWLAWLSNGLMLWGIIILNFFLEGVSLWDNLLGGVSRGE